MTSPGDDDAMMRLTHNPYDDVVEAIIHDEPVTRMHAPLVGFAREVRALGDGPVPAASAELLALLEGGPTAKAGLGRMAKLGLGASLAAAGVLGAGAFGVLPAAANNAVRGAIEVVTPMDFTDQQEEHPENFGSRVSTDATGESDGENGVDGQEIREEAPGAAQRGDSARPDAPPGQSDVTGQDRADQTPAGANDPNATSSDDDDSEDPGQSGEEHAPDGTPNSTVPPSSTVPPARTP